MKEKKTRYLVPAGMSRTQEAFIENTAFKHDEYGQGWLQWFGSLDNSSQFYYVRNRTCAGYNKGHSRMARG